MHCVIVGWKTPPKLEYAWRWAGSVWPREKNNDKGLYEDEPYASHLTSLRTCS